MSLYLKNQHFYWYQIPFNKESRRGVVSESKLQSYYHVHFRTNTFEKGMNFLILPAPLSSFFKEGFGIK